LLLKILESKHTCAKPMRKDVSIRTLQLLKKPYFLVKRKDYAKVSWTARKNV